jgi:ATP-dependent RNA helicase DHX34
MTKLRNQFQDLLGDCGLVDKVEPGQLTSAERSMRHGELRQLKELRKAHKMEAPKRRKLLKSDPWGVEDNDEDKDKIDIRDVEFRLKFDASKMNVNIIKKSMSSPIS